MKLGKTLTIASLCVAMTVFAASTLFAQNNNNNNNGGRGNRGGGGGNFDPAQFQARMVERATTDLKLDDQSAKVIVPKIEAIISFRFSANQEFQPLRQDLTDLVRSEKPSKAAIKTQLDKIKAKAAEIKAKTDALEADLKKLLSIQQEAELVLAGVLTEGMGMGGMGFGGGRGGQGGGGRGGNRGGNNNNNNN